MDLQRWLQIPACPSEAELVRAATSSSGSNSKGHHQHFLVEPGFDTSDDAVFSAAVFSQQDRVALQPVVWRRVTGTLVKPTEHYHSFSKVRQQGWWREGAGLAVCFRWELQQVLRYAVSLCHVVCRAACAAAHGSWGR